MVDIPGHLTVGQVAHHLSKPATPRDVAIGIRALSSAGEVLVYSLNDSYKYCFHSIESENGITLKVEILWQIG